MNRTGRTAFALIVCLLSARAAHSQLSYPYVTPFEQLAVTVRDDIVNINGIHSVGVDYATRKFYFDVFDVAWQPTLSAPGVIAYHPFLTPDVVDFTRAFFLRSWDQAIDDMDAGSPNPNGLRVYNFGGSSVVLEAYLPIGTEGSLKPYRIAVDFSDLTLLASGIMMPTTITNADIEARTDALAERIDIQFNTHAHLDHFSLSFTAAMDDRQHPSVMPPGMLALGIQYGFALPTMVAAATGVFPGMPMIDAYVYTGYQWNLDCNVYVFNFNVPVSGGPNDGITFIHFGDNEDVAGAGAFLNALMSSGIIKNHVMTANCSNPQAMAMSLVIPDVKFMTPTWEFSHFNGEGGWFGANCPTRQNLNPAVRLPLFPGESVHYPSDFPL